MTGIQFITDEAGRRTAAVIDLTKHKALWEDIEDALVSRLRWHEKSIPLDKVKADLIKSEVAGLATALCLARSKAWAGRPILNERYRLVSPVTVPQDPAQNEHPGVEPH